MSATKPYSTPHDQKHGAHASSLPLVAPTATVAPASNTPSQAYYAALVQWVSTHLPNYASYLPVENSTNYPYSEQAGPQLLFNTETSTYLNQLVTPGDAPNTLQFPAGQAFQTSWAQLLSQMYYGLSLTDVAANNAANALATKQGIAAVNAYTQTFGAITQTMLTAAIAEMKWPVAVQPFTNLNFVVDYTMGYLWSGYHAGLIKAPLTAQYMQLHARNLQGLLISMPSGGSAVLSPVTNYFSAMGPSTGFTSELSFGNWMISQLNNNVASPSATNGGMAVFDPSGLIPPGTFEPALTVTPSVEAIENALDTTTNAITMNIAVTVNSSTSSTVSINGGAGFDFGGPLLSFSTSGSFSYDSSQYVSAGMSYTIAITYPGVTQVTTSPLVFDPSTGDGWFSASPLQQAFANWTLDQARPTTAPNTTGYNFASKPASNLVQGGNFGLLTGLLLAQYPTVTVTYTTGNVAQAASDFRQTVSGGCSLFGFIPLGSFSETTSTQSSSFSQSSSGFSITLAPPQDVVPVGNADAMAYVIGASVQYPAAPTSSVTAEIRRLASRMSRRRTKPGHKRA